MFIRIYSLLCSHQQDNSRLRLILYADTFSTHLPSESAHKFCSAAGWAPNTAVIFYSFRVLSKTICHQMKKKRKWAKKWAFTSVISAVTFETISSPSSIIRSVFLFLQLNVRAAPCGTMYCTSESDMLKADIWSLLDLDKAFWACVHFVRDSSHFLGTYSSSEKAQCGSVPKSTTETRPLDNKVVELFQWNVFNICLMILHRGRDKLQNSWEETGQGLNVSRPQQRKTRHPKVWKIEWTLLLLLCLLLLLSKLWTLPLLWANFWPKDICQYEGVICLLYLW